MATRWTPPPPRPYPPRAEPPPPASRGRLVPLRRAAGFMGRWTIPIVGGVTPVALILVNVAVWINDHVNQISLWIAIAAFLSGMMLNTWWVLSIYRFAVRRWPRWGIFDPGHEELLLVLGMGAITVFTFVLALGVYFGLRDTKHLPNAYTLWWGILQIIIPIVAKVFFDRDREGRPASGRRPPAARGEGVTSRSQPPVAPSAGYVPPRSLPPS